jgi:hypothetical protein
MAGYYFAKDKNRWVARIKVHNEMLRLGQFETEREAALAYDYASKRLNRTDLNFPGEPIPKAIRDIVKPKLEKFKVAEKLESAVVAVDQKIWDEGEAAGLEWAAFCPGAEERVLSLNQAMIANDEPSVVADLIGCGDDFDHIVSGQNRIGRQPIRSRINQLALIRGFLIGAQRYFKDVVEERERRERAQASLAKWLADKNKPAGEEVAQDSPNEATEAQAAIVVDGNAEPIKASREHLSTLLAELQAKRKEQDADAEFKPVDHGDLVPGTMPQPNGEVWSADCNPVTLAEANAAIADAKKNRTGIFAMMDEIDRQRADRKAAEVERLLAEIL